ncbi:MAG: hypothetical protein WD512_04495 [Candidatus Paceibacterota bacterium]
MKLTKLKSFKPYTKGSLDNVLEIGDQHEPFSLDGYLEFCREQQEKYKCARVHFVADHIDGHGMSYHEHDPDGMSTGDETCLALERLKAWFNTFPVATSNFGNHCILAYRKMKTAGISKIFAKDFKTVIGAPKTWNFANHHVINNVFYTHGTGVSGEGGAMKIAQQNRMSSCIGHLHSVSNIRFSASYKDLIWAKTVGCGIDNKAYAFEYGKDFVAKPIINCGVTLERGRVPLLIPMNL